jgi:hypothetical protein
MESQAPSIMNKHPIPQFNPKNAPVTQEMCDDFEGQLHNYNKYMEFEVGSRLWNIENRKSVDAST